MGPPGYVFDSILALLLQNTKQHLEAAISEESRIIRAFMGFGNAGIKEVNKVIIYQEVETRRGASIDEKPPTMDIDDEFSDSVLCTYVLQHRCHQRTVQWIFYIIRGVHTLAHQT